MRHIPIRRINQDLPRKVEFVPFLPLCLPSFLRGIRISFSDGSDVAPGADRRRIWNQYAITRQDNRSGFKRSAKDDRLKDVLAEALVDELVRTRAHTGINLGNYFRSLDATNRNWRFITIAWAAVGGIVVWVVYSTKGTMASEFSQLNATLPDYLNLTADGVKIDGPNGASAFLPWRTFKGWREGRTVVLIDLSQGKNVVILPVAQLSESERLSIRQLLESHIPGVGR